MFTCTHRVRISLFTPHPPSPSAETPSPIEVSSDTMEEVTVSDDKDIEENYGSNLGELPKSLVVQIDLLDEAAECFEEAKGVLEVEYGPHHPDKLGVYINLAS
ncbi:hypothetical protein E3N88_00589 [Mikania micrantha]|uniref:Uncharacterized protein n=1 Tax=Mikania micrantha TaxID=192012 RepID=A0A5N6PZA7_9ASTR|nr:hypothetical protein E3N88_00589 [Mikania micrantha]